MSDILCRKCAEPWDVYYLRHEAGYEPPGIGAPANVYEAHIRWGNIEYNLYDPDSEKYGVTDADEAARLAHDAVYRAVASGQGCPSCWDDPSRVLQGEEAEEAALAGLYSLLDSTDDDPAEFF